jgi:hypothetical protein
MVPLIWRDSVQHGKSKREKNDPSQEFEGSSSELSWHFVSTGKEKKDENLVQLREASSRPIVGS